MDSTSLMILIFSIIITILVIIGARWFFRRKNPPKISETEERQEFSEKPKPNEIDDPLN